MDKNSSKFLALILRHDPVAVNITLDAGGWANISQLLDGMSKKGHHLTFDDLKAIVKADSKQRYLINDDQTKIRANQGHSIPVDLGLIEKEPSDILYHGTATRFQSSIMCQGLLKMSRNHVHLSPDNATAIAVGSRHGKPLVISINAKRMYNDGFKFYLSENGVWLTDNVPIVYFTGV